MKQDRAAEFRDLYREIDRATYGTVLLADCEPQFNRLLEFIRGHPDVRPQFAECFRPILSSHITRFCMGHLQWPEVAAAARERMQEDIGNPEGESLKRLLAIHEPTSEAGAKQFS